MCWASTRTTSRFIVPVTNGLAVYVEINIEGKRPMEITHINLDRGTLENEHAGQDIPVFIAVNPVGSLDGEGIYSAKSYAVSCAKPVCRGPGPRTIRFIKTKAGYSTGRKSRCGNQPPPINSWRATAERIRRNPESQCGFDFTNFREQETAS